MELDEALLYRRLGEQLRLGRVRAGLTQAELADRAGLLRTSITNIEAGRQHPPLHVLYRLCSTLGTDLAAILPSQEELSRPDRVAIEVEGTVREVPLKTAEFIRQLLREGS